MMVGQYIWGTLQVHRVMDDFLRTQFLHHTEVELYITIYLFENRDPRVEVLSLKNRVKAQAKTLSNM